MVPKMTFGFVLYSTYFEDVSIFGGFIDNKILHHLVHWISQEKDDCQGWHSFRGVLRISQPRISNGVPLGEVGRARMHDEEHFQTCVLRQNAGEYQCRIFA